ncbi:hypothetical protein SAMN05216223_110262 [Actinacidiphila yanglinensis]|uniref:Integral membrane protein n=1 Tax=Actinacidiphila yanglinensis TaxID=310779 RepID=A0A1H6CX17_9ACTN|nr:hypothetical protein [Actinacidiphila yanglinensis]SEG77669.1 hypothetical protein SAMN05216223_110262 [Actinacidiphila yanglinensis]
MSGNAQDMPDEDALLVLTAAMLTPGGFPGVLGDDYPAACEGLGLEALAGGYGLVFGQDASGARWTVATTDAAMVACALAAWDCGLEYDLSPDERTMVASLPGWPLPVAVAAPGVPAPHDPDEESIGGPVLAPPDTSVWGPPQRRLGADEIAIRWRDWRDQFDTAGTGVVDTTDLPDGAGDGTEDDAGSAAPQGSATTAGEAITIDGTPPDGADRPTSTDDAAGPSDKASKDAEATATGPSDGTGEAEAATGPAPEEAPALSISHDGVRRALESAEAYVRVPPPPGRVRTAYGAVRADGPGWSLVGRTDDMAFVLLDEAPGEVLPVGRGPSLPPLLEALGKLAWAEVNPV